MYHLYFIPVQRVIENGEVFRGPKYLKWSRNPGGIAVKWSMIDYGLIDVALVAADVTLAQHQQAYDRSDVLSIDPRNGTQRNLDANITEPERAALVAYLDTANNFVPMQWASTTDTRRQVIRGICGIFLFVQRVTVLSSMAIGDWGITLGTTWSELTDQQRGWIRDAARSLQFDADDPGPSVTVRQIIRSMANRLQERTFYLGGYGRL